ncbi:piggyBac transposable element-derived protein 3-like [Ixodes scapularis]|uniref:piggyBac transposable element-derived protein 3-like n=1 Tax=Ixodes scapularis TaxID=6945 RepID=UPI001A9F1168|nr:piggyBac transposable element-derived protein 3-like [Ixodes scapularis]
MTNNAVFKSTKQNKAFWCVCFIQMYIIADESQCNDKLYKLRPLIDGLNRQFKLAYGLRREACVDESIILFKGRSSMKQYNPMKPIKHGYKIWCLGDMSGFIQTFQVYQGKQERATRFFFDNYFSSVSLMAKLKMEKTCACATIRSNRRQLPELRFDKSLTRGEHDFKTTEEGITLFKWKDNKVVYIISNYHGCEVGTVERMERDGTKITVSCPNALSD